MASGTGKGFDLVICERILRNSQYAAASFESSPGARNAAERLQGADGYVLQVHCEVSRESNLVPAMEGALEFSTVRCVISNAGIFPRTSAREMDFEDFMNVVKVIPETRFSHGAHSHPKCSEEEVHLSTLHPEESSVTQQMVRTAPQQKMTSSLSRDYLLLHRRQQ